MEKIAKALGDSTRLKILMEMHAQNGTIQCAQIMGITNLAQPSVSHHIKILLDCELIEAAKDGRNYSYTLNFQTLQGYARSIQQIAGIASNSTGTILAE